MPAEGVQQFGFQMVFARIHAGPQQSGAGLHGAHMGFGADLRGAAHGVQLAGVLDQAHLVQQCAGVELTHRHERTLTHAGAQAVQPAGDAGFQTGVRGKGIGNDLGAIKQTRQFRVDAIAAAGCIHPECCGGGFRAQAIAIPDFAFQILGLAEQRGLRARLCIGAQHQRGAGLGKTGQIEEVAVVPVRKIAVAVTGAFGCGGNHGDGIRAEQGGKTGAALGAEGKIGHGGRVTPEESRHGGTCKPPLSLRAAPCGGDVEPDPTAGNSSRFARICDAGCYHGPTRFAAGRPLVPVFVS